MSSAIILAEVAKGPKTVAQLAEVIDARSNLISSRCRWLVKKGKIKRIDGNEGCGVKAIYAAPDYTSKAPIKQTGRVHFKIARAPEHPGHIVHRDPCFYCGARGDLPCKHDRRLS